MPIVTLCSLNRKVYLNINYTKYYMSITSLSRTLLK